LERKQITLRISLWMVLELKFSSNEEVINQNILALTPEESQK
jgi:hypothetical protein